MACFGIGRLAGMVAHGGGRIGIGRFSKLLVGWLAWLGIGRLAGMVGHGGRPGMLLEGNSEYFVET